MRELRADGRWRTAAELHRLPVEALRAFRSEAARVEFCFVNDGSRDGTLRLIESLAKEDCHAFRS